MYYRIFETWRLDYNHVRPHSSLGYHTPTEVYQQFTESLTKIDVAGFS